ncbi:MAG: polysaccharide deacetylase family protein [Candidatus Pelethousia sp.]|nr:polysaccharide deacetylase family protein [Candidatus Pelethousia sp.]
MSTTSKKRRIWVPKAARVTICLGVLIALTLATLVKLGPSALPLLAGSNMYDATAEIRAAKARFAAGEAGMAELVDSTQSKAQKVELAFQGMARPEAMEKILDLLQEHDKEASFFVSGIDASEDEASLQRAVREGHTVGSYGLRGEKHMETKDDAALVDDFCRANKIIKTASGSAPIRMMCNTTQYTDTLRRAAWASGIETIEQTTYYVSFQSFTSYAQVKGYVDRLPHASIVAIKMEGPLDEIEYEPPVEDDKPAVDMQDTLDPEDAPGPDEEAVDMRKLDDEQRLLLITEWFLKALDDTNYLPEAAELLEKNGGALAEHMTDIHTTHRASAFLFYDLGNQAELNYLLGVLAETDAHATFLVTTEEATAYAGQIRAVLAKGHDLGIALKPLKKADVYAYCTEILRCRETLKEEYGYTGANIVKLAYGSLDDAMREAISATGCTLLEHGSSITKTRDELATDPEVIYEELFGGKRIVLRRGHIVYFRMNFYRNSDTLLGDMVRLIIARNSTYPIESANTILADTDLLYTYPLPANSILPEVKDKIYAGQLHGELIDMVEKHYIGFTQARTVKQLPGFTTQEVRRINYKGLIQNDENAIFFTIDDWGSDDTITKLLDVLHKHNAKATFCVRTNNIYTNPNLLRAIALEGHDIASHTESHLPLATELGNNRFAELTAEQQQVLKEDLILSYQTLQSVVGDVKLENGKPALTTLFRPPTLAVGKMGMEAVFDCGFTYIVSGAYTSEDYIADSAEKLLAQMHRNIRESGTVIVMHMSDNSLYTAEALDAFLTENDNKPAAQQFVCRRLSDYLDGSYTNPAR